MTDLIPPETQSIVDTYRASKLYSIFDVPQVVFSCRVNQVFTSVDKLAQVTYDTPVGSYTAVKFGMTVAFGSAALGHDLGLTYARKDFTATVAYIGESSGLKLADDVYVTVYDSFGVWERSLRILKTGTVLMDYDIAYSDQNTNFNPMVRIGPDRIVEYEGENVFAHFADQGTSCPRSTISSWAWTCADAVSVTGETTSSPVFEFSAVGRYLAVCTVTAANGKLTTVYRYVYVWDENASFVKKVLYKDGLWDWGDGGWNFSFYTHEPFEYIVDKNKVLLVTKHYYADSFQKLGNIQDCETLLGWGWIDQSSIVLDADHKGTAFSVKGLHFWLDKISAKFSYGVLASSATPSQWTQIKNMTLDEGAHNLWYHRLAHLRYFLLRRYQAHHQNRSARLWAVEPGQIHLRFANHGRPAMQPLQPGVRHG
jgi:hypothetical protein